jgi:hypothetical protein
MNRHNGVINATAFAKQLDTSGEIAVPTSGIWHIKTKNSVYEWDADNKTMKGGWIGDTPVGAYIVGTTFGGSMIKPGVLIPDAYMEAHAKDKDFTTSRIVAIKEASLPQDQSGQEGRQ